MKHLTLFLGGLVIGATLAGIGAVRYFTSGWTEAANWKHKDVYYWKRNGRLVMRLTRFK